MGFWEAAGRQLPDGFWSRKHPNPSHIYVQPNAGDGDVGAIYMSLHHEAAFVSSLDQSRLTSNIFGGLGQVRGHASERA